MFHHHHLLSLCPFFFKKPKQEKSTWKDYLQCTWSIFHLWLWSRSIYASTDGDLGKVQMGDNLRNLPSGLQYQIINDHFSVFFFSSLFPNLLFWFKKNLPVFFLFLKPPHLKMHIVPHPLAWIGWSASWVHSELNLPFVTLQIPSAYLACASKKYKKVNLG